MEILESVDHDTFPFFRIPVEIQVFGKCDSKNLQQGKSDGEGTQEIELTIPVRRNQETQYNLNREILFF